MGKSNVLYRNNNYNPAQPINWNPTGHQLLPITSQFCFIDAVRTALFIDSMFIPLTHDELNSTVC
jgi:hypothetical protein